MKIVHIVNSLTIGGREKVVIELCNELVLTEKVSVITLTNDKNLQKNKLHPNIELIELPFTEDFFGLFKLWTFGFFILKRELNRIKPDIIHNHIYYHFYFFLALVNIVRNDKSKSFRTIHTSGLFYKNNGLLNKFRLKIEKVTSLIDKPFLVSISQSIFQNNLRHFKKRYSNNVYIPNGISFNALESSLLHISRLDLGFKEEDFIGVYVARLDTGKNHKLVIEAVNKLNQAKVSLKMIFVGDGKLMEELENLVAKYKLEDQVAFVGFTNNVSSYLKIADFGVYPSDFEGFGLSLVEKMYFELPVVASDIDVFKEIVVSGQNGLLFSLEKGEGFIDNIHCLFKDRELVRAIGIKAKETALNFEISSVANKTLNYYKNSL